MRKTLKTRNDATKRELRKMIKLSPHEIREAYLQLLTEVDSACDDIEVDASIIECERKHGSSWRHLVYDKCLIEGRTMFNRTYSQFFGNIIVESSLEMFERLPTPAQREVEEAVGLALKASRPKLMATYGPKFRAFRIIGNPLLSRFAPETEVDGYDTDYDTCGLSQFDRDEITWKDMLKIRLEAEH